MKHVLVLFQPEKDNKALLKKLIKLTDLDEIRAQFVVVSSKANAKTAEKVKNLQKWLKKHHEKLSGMDVSLCDPVITDAIIPWIHQRDTPPPFDLVIKLASRKPKKFFKALDLALLRELRHSVLLASEQKWRSKAIIMATVDVETRSKVQAEINRRVLLEAAAWADKTEMTLTVLYIIPISAALEALDIVERGEVLRKKQAQVTKKIETLTSSLGIEAKEIIVDVGNPVKLIPSKANKHKADLVVMGNVGRTGIKGLLLGRTAEQTLENLRTDVLVVKP